MIAFAKEFRALAVPVYLRHLFLKLDDPASPLAPTSGLFRRSLLSLYGNLLSLTREDSNLSIPCCNFM